MRKQSRGIKKLVLSAMFMAIGLILPFITGLLRCRYRQLEKCFVQCIYRYYFAAWFVGGSME